MRSCFFIEFVRKLRLFALQSQTYVGLLNFYHGVPVPPEAKLELVETPEAREQFEAGDGGLLGFPTAPFNGIWAPPIDVFRAATFLPVAFKVQNPSDMPLTLQLSQRCTLVKKNISEDHSCQNSS